jgi:hypothetical protein
MDRASLAACLKGDGNSARPPTPVSIAIHLVREIAQAERRADVTPEHVLLGYDGSVELTADGAQGTRRSPAYLSPEQIAGDVIDRRADVFALGAILWELLTGKSLFGRETDAATQSAIMAGPIPDVRDETPEVPGLVADVLRTALERDRDARFDTLEAFSKALGAARTSSGISDIGAADLGRWAAQRIRGPRSSMQMTAVVAPRATVPDLDIPGTSRSNRSQASMQAVKAPSDPTSVPAFDVSAMAAAALAPTSRGSVPSSPPRDSRTSSIPASARASMPTRPSVPSALAQSGSRPPPSISAPTHGGGKSIDFSPTDDDDFDMEIERNVAGSMSVTPSTRPSGMQAPASRRPGGLELAAPSRMAREGAAARQRPSYEPGTASALGGGVFGAAIAGATAFGLWKYMHHAGGRDLTGLLPHAFDGTSATESGAVSLVALVVAVVIGAFGLRVKPHAWAIVAAAGAMLLLSLAMVTVTLASTGENPTPPDGVLLVPYLLPMAILFFALGLVGRSARRFTRRAGSARAMSFPLAAIAGALVFAAFEISRLAH